MGNRHLEEIWSKGSMTKYIREYEKQCSILNDGISKADIKKHNKAMDKLGKLFHELKSVEDKSFALKLMQDTNKQVALTVAAHCLGWGDYINEAKRTLRKIAKSKDEPLLAFEAEMTLKVYCEQGYLDF